VNARRGISIAIGVWLTCIVVFPLQNSILNRYVPWPLYSFANTAFLSMPWRFFSPEPAGPLFIDVVAVVRKEGVAERELAHVEYPDPSLRAPIMEQFFRNAYWARAATADSERTRRLFVPFICRRFPGATHVAVQRRWADHPSLERARLMGGADEARATQDLPVEEVSCSTD
jgi:hypothetical protein